MISLRAMLVGDIALGGCVRAHDILLERSSEPSAAMFWQHHRLADLHLVEGEHYAEQNLMAKYYREYLEAQANSKDIKSHLVGESIELRLRAGLPADRWGRKVITLCFEKGTCFSKWLLTNGLAVVSPQELDTECIDRLLSYEKAGFAKISRTWRKTYIVSTEKNNLEELRGKFIIAEGKVVTVGKRRKYTYLNFGKRWTEDFTGIIQVRSIAKKFGKSWPAEALIGKRVQIRGILQMNMGPEIKIFHPGQLEVLGVEHTQ
ncbi:hypothetical protein [Polycladidibacter stylochi]|uniref:hypothetical protein n=1 Tax=Polycladidibacter stylochi TaxID=1807766 RepID=UPI0012E3F870|nr:hypothetical protein [Pseudovibrio stylochi]